MNKKRHHFFFHACRSTNDNQQQQQQQQLDMDNTNELEKRIQNLQIENEKLREKNEQLKQEINQLQQQAEQSRQKALSIEQQAKKRLSNMDKLLNDRYNNEINFLQSILFHKSKIMNPSINVVTGDRSTIAGISHNNTVHLHHHHHQRQDRDIVAAASASIPKTIMMSESKLRLTKLIPSSTTTTVTNHSRKTTELIGGKHSFLCPNGTIFSQEYLICDWWYNVKCDESPRFYPLNRDVYASGLNLCINGANHNHNNNNNDHQQQQKFMTMTKDTSSSFMPITFIR
ncbi:hypothetical protein DERF_012403 [Dermatophagoides farinae]|uniref:Chitin-binding type-2 domain-containing protein n=1 Tax=Dermatophagoides farinae TaxID=6954 RepID=A0A922HTE3_DERFA|nr:hypothetical protein DERF_012403 [Dermatophagoides farinae]